MLKRVEAALPGAVIDLPPIRPVLGTGLRIVRGNRTLLAIDDFGLDGRGLTAVIGPNGAGKSLLLKVIAGLLSPDAGDVTWAGAPPTRKGYRRLGMMLQGAVLMRRSVSANVEYALRAAGFPKTDTPARAERLLKSAGLHGLARSSARVLSGGERQRLALVRTLATEPEVLLLDEPSASLDPASTLAIERLIGQARGAGVRIVLVTHDVAQARRLADDIIFMHRGRAIERASAARFFAEPSTPEARAFIAGELLI